MAENMKWWGSRTKARCCLRLTVHNCVAETQLPDTLADDRWLLLTAWCCTVSKYLTAIFPHMSNFPCSPWVTACASARDVLLWVWDPCFRMYSDASDQQTINTAKNAKDSGLNILNTLRSFWMVPLSGCISLSCLRVVLAVSFSHLSPNRNFDRNIRRRF